MARKPEKEVVRWLSPEELNKEIRNRKIEASQKAAVHQSPVRREKCSSGSR